MKVKVSKKALKEFIENAMDSDAPVKAVEMIPTQLAVEAPPVADPEYIPATIRELEKASQVIASEVPSEKIEKFYRGLHSLLDNVYDEVPIDDVIAESKDDELPFDSDKEEDEAWDRIVGGDEVDELAFKVREEVMHLVTIANNMMKRGDKFDSLPTRAKIAIQLLNPVIDEKSALRAALEAIKLTKISTGDGKEGLQNRLKVAEEIVKSGFFRIRGDDVQKKDNDLITINQILDTVLDSLGIARQANKQVEKNRKKIISLVKKNKSYKQLKDTGNALLNQVLEKIIAKKPQYPMLKAIGVFDSKEDVETKEIITQPEDVEEETGLPTLGDLAKEAGFSGESGIRQWLIKHVDRKVKALERGVISSEDPGSQVFLKIYTNVLEMIPEPALEVLEDVIDFESDRELLVIYKKAHEDIEKLDRLINQKGVDTLDLLNPRKSGSKELRELLYTVGGFIVREMNAELFAPIFTQIDKDWTNFVAEELKSAGITGKYTLKGKTKTQKLTAVAEYFTGKKNVPVYSDNPATMSKSAEALVAMGVTPEIFVNIYKQAVEWSHNAFDKEMKQKAGRVSGKTVQGAYFTKLMTQIKKKIDNQKNMKKLLLTAFEAYIEEVAYWDSNRQAVLKGPAGEEEKDAAKSLKSRIT